jgi:hypothetical protein
VLQQSDSHEGSDVFESGTHALPEFDDDEPRACQQFTFQHSFSSVPKIIVSPSHRNNEDRTHLHTIAWVESVSSSSFHACWRKVGTASDTVDEHLHLEYFAWVGDSVGDAVATTVQTDNAVVEGTSCTVYTFPSPFVTQPYVIGSADHTAMGDGSFVHDTTNSWIEGVTTSQFTFCATHSALDVAQLSAVKFHFLAFVGDLEGSSLFVAGNAHGGSVSVNGGEQPLAADECSWQEFGEPFEEAPMVLATPNHLDVDADSEGQLDALTAWAEVVNTTGFLLCTDNTDAAQASSVSNATQVDWIAIGHSTGNSAPPGVHTRVRSPDNLVDASGECGLEDPSQCSQAWGGGVECDTFAWTQTDACNVWDCPVDCTVTGWSSWSACSQSCGGGHSHRSRLVTVSDANGGVTCPALAQTSLCNEDAPCSEWDLPECQLDHVHCEIKHHTVNAERAWMGGQDERGTRFYANTVTGESQYERPDGFVECGGPLPAQVWQTDNVVDLAALWDTNKENGLHGYTDGAINPNDEWVHGQFMHRQEGQFVEHVTPACYNNQNCGLVDLGACHGCDTEEECADLGMSSTVFVTHHREYMDQQYFNASSGNHSQVQYHCRRDGVTGCKCHCNAHPPCMAHEGQMLANEALHANAYPYIPNQQDCCNMCTNHPSCGAWEFSSTNVCILKSGAPDFVPVPAGQDVQMWAGCRAGETC